MELWLHERDGAARQRRRLLALEIPDKDNGHEREDFLNCWSFREFR